jgi:hypothetical protein
MCAILCNGIRYNAVRWRIIILWVIGNVIIKLQQEGIGIHYDKHPTNACSVMMF